MPIRPTLRNPRRAALGAIGAVCLLGVGFGIGRITAPNDTPVIDTSTFDTTIPPTMSTSTAAVAPTPTSVLPEPAAPTVEVEIGEVPTDGATLVAEAGPGELTDVPEGARRVTPGDDLAALAAAAEPGTVFVLTEGSHRL